MLIIFDKQINQKQGLVALADASAQCSRSEPSPVDSFSGFATPPPLFSSQSSWGEFEHGSISNGTTLPQPSVMEDGV